MPDALFHEAEGTLGTIVRPVGRRSAYWSGRVETRLSGVRICAKLFLRRTVPVYDDESVLLRETDEVCPLDRVVGVGHLSFLRSASGWQQASRVCGAVSSRSAPRKLAAARSAT